MGHTSELLERRLGALDRGSLGHADGRWKMDVALVALRVPGVENHTVRLLARALERDQLDHARLPFTGFVDLDRTVADISSSAKASASRSASDRTRIAE